MLVIHHVAAVVGDLGRAAAFYRRLGLRPLPSPVEEAGAGRAAAFGIGADPAPRVVLLERPGAGPGRPGAGALHHAAFTVATRAALLRWKRHLGDLGVRARGPFPRLEFYSLYFEDPDGATIELAARERNPAATLRDDPETGLVRPPEEFLAGGRDEAGIAAERWPEPVPEATPDMAIEGIHHVSALTTELDRVAVLLTEGLGLTLLLRTVNHDFAAMPHYFFGDREGRPGTLVTCFGNPPRGRLKPAAAGTGTWDHLTLAVPEEPALARCTARLDALGFGWSETPGHPGVRLHAPGGLRIDLVASPEAQAGRG